MLGMTFAAIAATIVLVGLAKRGRRRGSRLVVIPFSGSIALSTLANGIVIKVNFFSNAFDNEFYALSVRANWSIRTLTAGEVPIDFGYSLADYSVAEIAEKLNADEANQRLNQIAAEQARRKIRRTGIFAGPETDQTYADGQQQTSKLKFVIPDGGNLIGYARNSSGATLTTGATIQVFGTLFGRWI